ncbi:MAG: response regulator transcription factor [Anaerolineales bacterium]
MSKHILIVDDDDLMRRSLALSLEQAGYKASNAANAEDALLLARRDPPSLVLLDIGLPGMDGLDAIHNFKDEIGIPVIFLTARRRNLDEVLGLELGADDYITKPFDIDVLLAHLKAVLRRTEGIQPKLDDISPLVLGDLAIDPGAHTVTLAGQPVDLRPREFDLLHTLALQPGKVVPVEDILASVWGAEFIGEPQVVYVQIRWLRKKIEDDPDDPKRILTVHGIGYKLVSQGG